MLPLCDKIRVMKKRIALIILTVLMFLDIKAQDIHLSQYYAAPLNLNPAMTGYMGGTHRSILNYRNQWSSISSPFVTMAGSYDMVIGRDGLSSSGWGGAGLILLKDQAGSLDLSRLKIGLSGSYILKLSDVSYLSAGVQAAYNQRSIDYTNMLTDGQITPGGFDPSLASNEDVSMSSHSFMEFNTGVLWGYRPSQYLDLYTGLAFMHFNQPKDGFGGDVSTVGMRTVLHSGANVILNDRLMLQPAVILQHQRGVGEFVFGAAIGRDLIPADDNVTRIAYLGFWYRNEDAFVPYLGLELESWKLGLSYDINTSDLNVASGGAGGLELSLKWEIPRPSLRMYKAVPCPRF